MSVSKTEIIKEIAQQVPESENTVKGIVDAFLKTLAADVEKGEEVRFIGFGKFYKAHRAARQGRNPQTGEPLMIKESNRLAFKSALNYEAC